MQLLDRSIALELVSCKSLRRPGTSDRGVPSCPSTQRSFWYNRRKKRAVRAKGEKSCACETRREGSWSWELHECRSSARGSRYITTLVRVSAAQIPGFVITRMGAAALRPHKKLFCLQYVCRRVGSNSYQTSAGSVSGWSRRARSKSRLVASARCASAPACSPCS